MAKAKPTKTAAQTLIALVCRKSGVTHAEACKVLGWKSCRPYLLKVTAAAKIKLRKERQEDGQVRYFGNVRGLPDKCIPGCIILAPLHAGPCPVARAEGVNSATFATGPVPAPGQGRGEPKGRP